MKSERDESADVFKGPSGAPPPARLEAFSDGVIAIVVTIMVLELKPPLQDGLAGLRMIAPEIFVYLISFAFSGIYWLNHQHLIRRVRLAGFQLQVANLAFLFCLSLLPFSTQNLSTLHLSRFAVQQYAATLALGAVSFYGVRRAVHAHLRVHGRFDAADRRAGYFHLGSIGVYLFTISLAAWSPRITLFVLASATGVWIIPNLSPHVLKAPAAAS